VNLTQPCLTTDCTRDSTSDDGHGGVLHNTTNAHSQLSSTISQTHLKDWHNPGLNYSEYTFCNLLISL